MNLTIETWIQCTATIDEYTVVSVLLKESAFVRLSNSWYTNIILITALIGAMCSNGSSLLSYHVGVLNGSKGRRQEAREKNKQGLKTILSPINT